MLPGAPGGYDGCGIVHVDMDAFFASVEVLDSPDLAGRCVIVGGLAGRGVVAACTYEARARGVRSAMAMTEARRRCPDAVFLPGRFWRYAEVSRELHRILGKFTPLVEGIALDEAFMDVSGARRSQGGPVEIAQAVRSAIEESLHLGCSLGVARTKLVAKLASEAAKPRIESGRVTAGQGVVAIEPSEELGFLSAHPVEALGGVGPATAKRLMQLGVVTVGELAGIPEATLQRRLGQAAGSRLAALARGDDPRKVIPGRPVKSLGHEETFPSDVRDASGLDRHVRRLADVVSMRLRDAGWTCRTVTVKVRYADLATVTRSRTLTTPCSVTSEITEVAFDLISKIDLRGGVRLVGISLSGLDRSSAGSPQLSFEDLRLDGPGHGNSSREGVERAVDSIRHRYGMTAVGPAALLARRRS